MAEPYIRTRDLTKKYQSGTGELVVFSGLNLDVERGEMLALVGESGAGKSTLLHLLGGLDRPSGGTIHYGGREISGLAPSEQSDFRNREIGFVWQIHHLLPEFTAQENVMMPLLIRGKARAEAAAESLARLMKWDCRHGRRTGPANYRAESSSGSRWRALWLANPACCWPMSPRETSISGLAR